MRVAGAAVGLVPPVILGLALCSAAFRGLNRKTWPLAAALAAPVGLAALSTLFFLYAGAYSPGEGLSNYILLEGLVTIGSAAALWRNRHSSRSESDSTSSYLPRKWHTLLVVALCAAAAIALGRFLTGVLQDPDGRWDAWITWNLRARFIFLGQERWLDGFSRELPVGQTDYPLLLPISVARLWFYAGDASRLVPAAIAFVFSLGTIAAAGSALRAVTLPAQAMLATFTLACASAVTQAGASQYADVPLAFFFCSAVILYCLHTGRQGPSEGALAVLLGVSLGAAAWTKPEGISFLACFLASWIVFEGIVRRQARRVFIRSSLQVAAGMLPFLICLVLFETQMAGSNRFLADRELPDILQKLTDPGRYALIARAFLSQLWVAGAWTLGIVPLVLLALIQGRRKLQPQEHTTVACATALLALVAVSYFMVYVISPGNPQTRMAVSLSRLSLQLYPALVFIVFYCMQVQVGGPIAQAGAPSLR